MGSERFPQRVVRFLAHGSLSEPAGRRPLAFVHINKTAGTSFTEYLRAHFLEQEAIAPPFFGSFEGIGVDDRACELYWGHFPYAQFVEHRPDALFITFLRDPVQRVVSQYRSLHNPANVGGGWEKVLPAAARSALEFAQRSNFEEFVLSDEPFIVGHLRDLQTRFLTSHLAYDHPEFLSSAMQNLEHKILFFGITECFANSISLFRYQLGSHVEYHADRHQRNVSKPYDVEITDRAFERVEQLVQNDVQLYQHGMQLLERRFLVLDQLNAMPRLRAA